MVDACAPKSEERIRLNVAGQNFEIPRNTLESIPNTRVSALSSTDPNYDQEMQEYFFDRNPLLFPYILDAFREGKVQFPAYVPATTIRSELQFWELDEEVLSASNLQTCYEWDEQEKVNSLLADHNERDFDVNNKQHRIWRFLEVPNSSWAAMVWHGFFILMILLALAVISWMTVPKIRGYLIVGGSEIREEQSGNDGQLVLKVLYNICAWTFLVEFIVRCLVCPNKLSFWKSFFNIVDVLVIIPMIIVGIIDAAQPEHWMRRQQESTHDFLLAAVCIMRAIRILKVATQSRHLKIVLLAVKASLRELLFMILVLLAWMVVLSTIVFYAEYGSPNSHFFSVPDAFWYTIVSLTTVGYGDMRPLSPFGKFVGAVCSLSGIPILTIPIPAFINNFRLYSKLAKPIWMSKEAKTKFRPAEA